MILASHEITLPTGRFARLYLNEDSSAYVVSGELGEVVAYADSFEVMLAPLGTVRAPLAAEELEELDHALHLLREERNGRVERVPYR